MAHLPEWNETGSGEDLDPIAREAVAWFAAMHADHVADRTRSEFRAWLRRDTRHQDAYADVERMWSGVAALPGVKAHRRAARQGMTRRALGKAAIAAAIGGTGWLTYQQYFQGDYRTGTGETRSVRLPDNSKVEMAGATSLSLDFGRQLRLVTLHRGEAFFSSESEADRPFVVQAATGRTMGSGSSFNIDYVSDDDVRVTVLENIADVRMGLRDVRIEANRQVSYSRKEIGAPKEVDPIDALAWREGRLVFVSVPFGRVVASINRWRRGNLLIVNPSLAQRPVTLIVELDRVGDVPDILKDSLPIRLVEATPYLTLIFGA